MRCLFSTLGLLGALTVAAAGQGSPKIVVAHRGASGYLPEHTLEAYALAHGQGADFIEPDLVRTADGAFICLHDVSLDETTDVDQVFPDRRRADGHWYAADFSLQEIRRLRVHERLEGRFPRGTSRFSVPTFEEMVELIQGLNRTTGRTAGIYPELKQPTWHREQGLAMEEDLLALLRRYGYRGSDAPIFVQCFEEEALRRLRQLGSALPQIYLVGDRTADRLTEIGLREIAEFADGIGPSKDLVEQSPELVTWAHDAGLLVHPYTFRVDDVPESYLSFEDEIRTFYERFDVDGLFTDFPDRARSWLATAAPAGCSPPCSHGSSPRQSAGRHRG